MSNGIIWCIMAFVTCTLCGIRSTGAGISAVLVVGYFYGILRANFLDGYSHFIFDSGLIGFYLAQFSKPVSDENQQRSTSAKSWLMFMMGWPILLFLLPVNHYLVQLVGLRHIIFFIPILLIGTRVRTRDLNMLVSWIAVLNIIAFGVAVAQYFNGIESFFPRNATTEIMYRSKDISNNGKVFHRLPSIFMSAHSFAGTLVLTLPLFLNVISDRSRSVNMRVLISAVSVLTVLGLFMAGPRLPVIILFGFIVLLLVLPGLKKSTKSWLLAGMVIIGLVCATYVINDARMQRFATLQDTDMIDKRAAGSLHMSLLECFWSYPLGVGLGGVVGSSMPYFLKDVAPETVGAENEFVRIAIEQGLIGFFIWIALIATVTLRRPTSLTRHWSVGTHAMRAMVIISWSTAFIGTGMLQAIPSTVLLMLQMGVLLRDISPKRREELNDGKVPNALLSMPFSLTENRPELVSSPHVTHRLPPV